MVNRDYLQPAAIAAGIIKPGERFGFHLLRHSLSTWVNKETKDVKVAQELLRHSRPDITAGTYIHGVPEENLKAQGQFMSAMMNSKHPSATSAASLMATLPATGLLQ
jgi:integrase